jgi:hypothetical protein
MVTLVVYGNRNQQLVVILALTTNRIPSMTRVMLPFRV